MSERKANRLIKEKSPYLLQHAHNPVDWFSWGDEAFDRARREDKPVILSIGYSTCHWCHVMEHESFENGEIAALMNEHFVSIKVDREERPDLDQIYMTAVTAVTGQGGWPLTVFLTPDKMPFYGGTYFPPHSRWGHAGFTEVLNSISHSWKTDRPRILGASLELTQVIRQNSLKNTDGRTLDITTLDTAFHQLQSQFDPQYGGFGQAPKFPMGHTMSFLLRYWQRTGCAEALDMVEKTLTMMARGGLYDQIGGGFHRYSTDATWHVPHFEKMLYDQALLIRVYLEAYQVTQNALFAHIARQTIDYVLSQMCDNGGGFYSAQDADSAQAGHAHKKEGAFYVWGRDELSSLLGEDADICAYHFGAELDGNVASDPHQEFAGKNILFAAHTVEETAAKFGKESSEIEGIIECCVVKLLKFRVSRPHPHLDDKILVDWNGLMISSLAFASGVLNEARYGEAATNAADFMLKKMITPQGRLLHRYRDGDAAILGTLEDYAFFIAGLIDLYEATFEHSYLAHAEQLTTAMLDLFWDKENGGFFLTGHDAEELITRPKEIYDGAVPSGNSVAALVLLKMYHSTLNEIYQQKAEAVFGAFAAQVGRHPSAHTFCLASLDFAIGPATDIVLAAVSDGPELTAMRRVVFERFHPNRMMLSVAPQQSGLVSNEKRRVPIPEQGCAVYVCEGQVCRPPVFTHLELEALLMKVQPNEKG